VERQLPHPARAVMLYVIGQMRLVIDGLIAVGSEQKTTSRRRRHRWSTQQTNPSGCQQSH
jgi:hypothetical protein